MIKHRKPGLPYLSMHKVRAEVRKKGSTDAFISGEFEAMLEEDTAERMQAQARSVLRQYGHEVRTVTILGPAA